MKQLQKIISGVLLVIGVYLCTGRLATASWRQSNPSTDERLLDPTGLVTVRSTISYSDRNNNMVPARYARIYLFDHDLSGGDDQLLTASTDVNGFVQFSPFMNDDADDPSDPNRLLDLYIKLEAYYDDDYLTYHQVTNLGGQVYPWQSTIQNNIPDGYVIINLSITSTDPTRQAMWIFQDIRNTWEFVYNRTFPHVNPGSITGIWQDFEPCGPAGICSSHFWGGSGGPYVFIAYNNIDSADTVVHETGHHIMFNKTGWWLWTDPWCYDHDFFSQESSMCAWSEGWADFLTIALTSSPPVDTCYDWSNGHCAGRPDLDYFDLEAHKINDGWLEGEGVEARVAGALYDLFDSTNEAFYDSAYFNFDPIADIVFQGGFYPDLWIFWTDWRDSGYNKHHAVKAIYQNSVDYNSPPVFWQSLPYTTVMKNSINYHIFDLWDYTEDNESDVTELIYSVSVNECGISPNAGHWINIIPASGWTGTCTATVVVSDGIKYAVNYFWVDVLEGIYLPLLMK